MEGLPKIVAFIAVGAIIISINFWYVTALISSFSDSEIVFAPVTVIGLGASTPVADENLSRMLLQRIKQIEWGLDQSQAELQARGDSSNRNGENGGGGEDEDASSGIRPAVGIGGLLGPIKKAGLGARLFDPAKIDAKIGGVDVGGLLPRFQRWFVQDRIFELSITYLDAKTAIISGNADVLPFGDRRPFSLKVPDANTETIVDSMAHELLLRQFKKDNADFRTLNLEEFKTLIASISDIATINQRVIEREERLTDEYARVLASLESLSGKLSHWSELNYFIGSVAESAGESEKALTFYMRVKAANISPELAAELDDKIAEIERLTGKSIAASESEAFQRIEDEAKYATGILNELFGLKLKVPKVLPLERDYKNSYWDGKAIHAPSPVAEIPDIVYHEASWQFIQERLKGGFENLNGSIMQSYTDILTSVIRQRKRNQTAATAEWVIAEGSIAWLSGKLDKIKTDSRPLRSLKAPGTAYDDPVVGKDQQVSHIKNALPEKGTGGEYFVNSGIQNKAFYETSLRIGTDKAIRVWIESLGSYDKNTKLKNAAETTKETAQKLFGKNSKEATAVKDAWIVVGL